MVCVETGDVALPIAAGCGTLVAFCEQIDRCTNQYFPNHQRGRGWIDTAGVPAGAYLRGAAHRRSAPPRTRLKRKNKERQAAARRTHDFSFRKNGAAR